MHFVSGMHALRSVSLQATQVEVSTVGPRWVKRSWQSPKPITIFTIFSTLTLNAQQFDNRTISCVVEKEVLVFGSIDGFVLYFISFTCYSFEALVPTAA